MLRRLAGSSALALSFALPAMAQEVVVGIFGGSFAENSRACHAAAFEKANNARVRHVLGSSVDNVAKLRELSPLWEMFKDGIDLSTIQWAAH